jgi:hypothetical protein
MHCTECWSLSRLHGCESQTSKRHRKVQPMRKLILHMITSIDGFIADRDNWVGREAQWDEQMQRFSTFSLQRTPRCSGDDSMSSM